jgi:hypothetical protein
MRSKRVFALGALLVLALAVTAVAHAVGVSGNGMAEKVAFSTGGTVSTPSGTFVTVATRTFNVTTGGSPVIVRFSASGFVQDFGKGGVFVGKSYAALRVRVLLGSKALAPGAVKLFDNTGQIAVSKPRAVANSFEWVGLATSPGASTVKVQVANINAFDNAQINKWALVIQHH